MCVCYSLYYDTTHWRLLCMFVAGRDGRTADAEHWRQQWRHIYVVYVPPHALCPLFGMLAMFSAMAAEVRWVLISTLIFQGCWGPKFISQALDLLFGCVFLCTTWVGLCLGVLGCDFFAPIHKYTNTQTTVFLLCEGFLPSQPSFVYLLCQKGDFFGPIHGYTYKMTTFLFVYSFF